MDLLTFYRVLNSSILSIINIWGLDDVDDTRRQVLWDNYVKIRVREFWSVVIIIQDKEQDCCSAGERRSPTVLCLNCKAAKNTQEGYYNQETIDQWRLQQHLQFQWFKDFVLNMQLQIFKNIANILKQGGKKSLDRVIMVN